MVFMAQTSFNTFFNRRAVILAVHYNTFALIKLQPKNGPSIRHVGASPFPSQNHYAGTPQSGQTAKFAALHLHAQPVSCTKQSKSTIKNLIFVKAFSRTFYQKLSSGNAFHSCCRRSRSSSFSVGWICCAPGTVNFRNLSFHYNSESLLRTSSYARALCRDEIRWDWFHLCFSYLCMCSIIISIQFSLFKLWF